MAAWLHAHRPHVQWWCPQLPPSPRDAMQQVLDGVAAWPTDAHGASSAARSAGSTPPWSPSGSGARAVLLNPAVNPARDLAAHIGEQTAFHDPADHFFFRREYIDELRAMTPPSITAPHRYLAVIAKGDEVLDWREMRERYAASPTCASSKAATTRCPTSTITCPPSCNFYGGKPPASPHASETIRGLCTPCSMMPGSSSPGA